MKNKPSSRKREDRWRKKTITFAFLFFIIAGILVSSYLVKEHYAPTGNSFCDINAKLNCDVVNKSVYAQLMGVPVAIFGLLYYFALLIIILFKRKISNFLRDERLFWRGFLSLITLGVLFTLYLTSIEAFILHVFCPFCLLSALFIFSLLLLSIERNTKTY